ncbi:RNA polymerase sigma factor [Poritiphilus flavus]|uniref:Sigma-70 family RNA polymerase sigma factor n=1 Tax=Poritiphilus flavus TaxID=2697053 RepID=A0A6L9EBV0_9FLAO|nr:sigma-70 family RNA polymerase sigma factor [Poritiphilus flavus]NAS11889.1 sigma-70 family RNA polymerase sigma factor [Poritiphilus flavus]
MSTKAGDILALERLRNGEKDALYSLYDKYSGALYGVILRMCKREDLANDILQDTFVKIWQKIGTYDSQKGKFYTWAYRIAKNTTLNALRKTDNLIQTEDLNVYDNKSAELTKPDYTALNGILKKLEPHHRRALELVYFQGLTHREAHEEMGVPLGTFKSYVRQALKQLRQRYQNEALLVLWFIEALAYG